MKFTAKPYPFPNWFGPYSPARGSQSGFRVRYGKLGTWFTSDEGQSFEAVQNTAGTRQLTNLVKKYYGNGRVLFLPCGYVVKPLQKQDERGLRVLVGQYEGGFVISVGKINIDFSRTDNLFSPGSAWPGPGNIGLECKIQSDGSLVTKWYQPSDFGHNEYEKEIVGENRSLISAFHKARPEDGVGRVRITINGHVITNKQVGYKCWKPFYLGRIDTSQFSGWGRWMEKK